MKEVLKKFEQNGLYYDYFIYSFKKYSRKSTVNKFRIKVSTGPLCGPEQGMRLFEIKISFKNLKVQFTFKRCHLPPLHLHCYLCSSQSMITSFFQLLRPITLKSSLLLTLSTSKSIYKFCWLYFKIYSESVYLSPLFPPSALA